MLSGKEFLKEELKVTMQLHFFPSRLKTKKQANDVILTQLRKVVF